MGLQEAIVLGLSISALILSILAIVFEVIFFRIQTQQASSMTKENSDVSQEMKNMLSEIKVIQNVTGQQVKDQYDKLLDAAISKNKGTVKVAAGSAAQFEELNNKFMSLEKAVAGLKDSGKLQVQIDDLRKSIETTGKLVTTLATAVTSEEKKKPERSSRYERFSERARLALTKAQEVSVSLNHYYIGPEHILMGLVYDPQSIASKVIKHLGIDIDTVTNALKIVLGPRLKNKAREIRLTPQGKKVIELSVDEYHRLNDHYIGTQHLLLGVLLEGSAVSNVLEKLNITPDKVRTEVLKNFSHLSREP